MDRQRVFERDGFTLESERFASICLIGAWPGHENALAAHWQRVMPSPLPANGRQSVGMPDARAFAVHPQKVLAVSFTDGTLAQRLARGWQPEHGSFSEQSHGRVCFHLVGGSALNILRACLPLDPEYALPERGDFVQTRLQDATILLCRASPDLFELHAPTSFFRSVRDALIRAAKSIEL